MGGRALLWVVRVGATLDDMPLRILTFAAGCCMDDTAKLEKSRAWLADRARVSLRSLERHEPTLARLNFLVRGDGYYRLPKFFEYDHQSDRASDGQSEKEKFYQKKKIAEGFHLEIYDYAICRWCPEEHKWKLPEDQQDYRDAAPVWACPEFRATLLSEKPSKTEVSCE